MSDKRMNRLVALGVFLVTLVVYLRTLSVTVVFWDVGEFCAASWLLQVPHPPGSPLFLFVARVVSMIPFLPDIAARMHAVSAIGSALGIMFLYLVSVKVLGRFFRHETGLDRFILYGVSAVGALSLAFSTTYWDNAIEAEVYGMAMFFASAIFWLALRWWERADEPHNEKYLLLIAYILGISTGVHILTLLTTIPVLMMVYYRRYELTPRSLIWFVGSAIVIFFVIYPGIVQVLPSLLDGEYKGVKSEILPFIPALLIAAAAYGAWKSKETGHKMVHIGCLSFLLIVLGYTTYTQVIIRANVDNLPMKENEPKDLARLTGYLTREQYGETPQWKGESWNNATQSYQVKYLPRRWSREAMHEPTRANYTSDTDFLWRYQINHMFIRYLLWNFVGSEGDWQDAGVSAKATWALPLFLALLGIAFHFKKDWKMASVFLATFVIMGIVLDLYQNQQDPQPRERDYFYVGAYYCLALWIGAGVLFLIELARTYLSGSVARIAAVALVLAGAVAAPVSLARMNWHEHDRSQNYIAWDYSYNLLQTCDKDAILFTNGDNDTFPLWYLQDVEGVRRDVRIVNLSLVNTSWYIKLLKNETPHGARKVAMTVSDAQIDRITPTLWRPSQVSLPVPPDVLRRFNVTDSSVAASGKLSWTMNGIQYDANNRIVRVQDLIALDIIRSNKWERPVYFATTCAPDSKIGLEPYLWMDGMAYVLKPQRISATEGSVGGIDLDIMESNILGENVTSSQTPQRGYLYRNLNNPAVYYDENVQRMVSNYRAGFMRLTFHALRVQNNPAKARKYMERMEELIPIDVVPNIDWRFTSDMMTIYDQVGDKANYDKYAAKVIELANAVIASNRIDENDPFMPYRALLEVYDKRKEYQSAIDVLQRAQTQIPDAQNSPELRERITYYQKLLTAGGTQDSAKH